MEIDAKNPMPSRRKKSELLHKLQDLSAGSGLQLACNKSARTSKSKSPGQVERTLYPPGFGARHRRRRSAVRLMLLVSSRCPSSVVGLLQGRNGQFSTIATAVSGSLTIQLRPVGCLATVYVCLCGWKEEINSQTMCCHRLTIICIANFEENKCLTTTRGNNKYLRKVAIWKLPLLGKQFEVQFCGSNKNVVTVKWCEQRGVGVSMLVGRVYRWLTCGVTAVFIVFFLDFFFCQQTRVMLQLFCNLECLLGVGGQVSVEKIKENRYQGNYNNLDMRTDNANGRSVTTMRSMFFRGDKVRHLPSARD